ncbi:MAG: choice-of-anchor D domain-containing protein, partial [Candidatus Sulfotelmatobacter sp.]
MRPRSRKDQASFVAIYALVFLASTLCAAQSVTLLPSSLSFGNQPIAVTSTAKTVTLRNSQSVALTIASISGSGDYAETNTCGTSLAAGTSCTVSVTLTPTATGTRTGALTVTDNAGNSPQTVSLTGTGVAQAFTAPATLAFGVGPVGITSAAKTVTITNNLAAALSISSLVATGDYAQTNNCGSSLGAGASCTATVTFTATTTGARSGTLSVTDSANNSPQTVSLTGTGVPQVTVSPTTLAFGVEPVGITNAVKTVTITNNLATALSISSIGSSGDYAQSNNCGSSLAAGASCTASVTFTPTTTGARTGSLTITDDANNSPQTVSLTGNGVVQILVSPATLAFGSEALAISSASKSVSITNNLATSLSISALAISGDYTQTNNCGSSLTSGASCTANVTFTPTAIGARTGTLTVTDGGNNSPQTVSLTGTGTALPHITSLSASSGVVGASVTIQGTGFGAAQNGSTVTFGGSPGSPATWSATSISVTVPSGAATGNAIVTVNGGPSNGATFTVVPNILNLSPNSGAAGTPVTITGTSFGSTQGSVTFNGTTATPSNWNSGTIIVPVPNGATNGNVVVTAGGIASGGVTFTVAVAPQITSVSSSLVAVGTDQCVNGSGFGASQVSGSSFLINSTALTTDLWNNTLACATIPANFTPGAATLQIVTSAGSSTTLNFTVTGQPAITGVSPPSGLAGTQLTITGTHFGPTQYSNSKVLYRDSFPALAIVSWSDTQIVAIIPAGTTTGSGEIDVENNGLWAVSSNAFTVSLASAIVATTGQMTTARYAQTATELTNGQVLIAGGTSAGGAVNSVELYSPTGETFAATGSMSTARTLHSATLLNDGTVLIVGGLGNNQTALNSTEIYSGGTFTVPAASLNTARAGHTATLLNNGQVLIVGGYDPASGIIPTAELYDPATQSFISLGNTAIPRYGHTATVLQGGLVLIAGGEADLTPTAAYSSAEIFNPATKQFTPLSAAMTTPREGHAATLLNSGQVLITGGDVPGTGSLNSAEIYDPIANTFTALTSSMTAARILHRALLLNGGTVLISGGNTDSPGTSTALNTAELYDPGSQAFTAVTGSMASARQRYTATLLSDGTVLLAGGTDGTNPLITSDLYMSSQLAGLNSISIQTTGEVRIGGQQQLVATGYFSDGSTQSLASALWSSSATNVAVSDDATNPGIANGVSAGSATITAAAGGVNGSATIMVAVPVAIAVSPQNVLTVVGSTQQFTATAIFSDGSTQDVTASATWTSSVSAIAAMTGGSASALSQGLATIQATSGSLSASTTLNVAGGSLVSISLSPANPSITLDSSQQLTLAATGAFSDGSSGDITSNVAWSSSNTAVATVFPPGVSAGLVVPVSTGSSNIGATLSSVSASTPVTVVSPTVQPTPAIQTVSPTNGVAGTQVTVTGSGFGTIEGSGAVMIGSAPGSVVSWSDGQIVATVNTGSTSGIVQVQQNSLSSNSVSFTVNGATVLGVSPGSGVPGTQVTVTGSGFGASQGNGSVWLGTAAGIVNSWSDTQVVATVSSGAISGNAQILQNGVWSNSVPFTVEVPHIQSINPNSGSAGTVVTVTGSGFGSAQGNGTVWVGSTSGSIVGWSDTQVIASVASSAVSGIVKVQQSGVWSNAITFTIPGGIGSGGGGSTLVTLVPNVISMLVGDTRSIQALNSTNQEATGLTWSSSDNTVVTLSPDDPPIITAVGSGYATITAGTASADVAVSSAATFANGTVLWSDPGDASGVKQIVPAVPSATGIADVFALQNDCSVQATASDGTVAWTVSIGTNVDEFGNTGCNALQPDFQGGFVVVNQGFHGENQAETQPSIQRFDGMTGVASPPYLPTNAPGLNPQVTIHTDGTIFTIDSGAVFALDPTTGSPKFQVQVEQNTSSLTGTECLGDAISIEQGLNVIEGVTSPAPSSAWFGQVIIAGDGYLYVPYAYVQTMATSVADGGQNGEPCTRTESSGSTNWHFRMLRVGTDGSSSKISLRDWSTTSVPGFSYNSGVGPLVGVADGVDRGINDLGKVITNADQGIGLLWWEADSAAETQRLTMVSSAGIISDSVLNAPALPAGSPTVTPVLQSEDGSYVGTFLSSVQQGILTCTQINSIAYDQSANVRWMAQSYTPAMAIAGGSVILNHISPTQCPTPPVVGPAVTFDKNGNQIGQIANMPTQSWRGNSYQVGSVDQIASSSVALASSFWAFAGANQSGN